MIDKSGSIRDNEPPGGNNWQLMIDFVKSIIRHFTVGQRATRIAVVLFGMTNVNVKVYLKLKSLASLGFVTRGSNFKKTDTTFITHCRLENDYLFSVLTTPVFPRRISSVLSKSSHKSFILFGCHPLDGVNRGCPPSPSRSGHQ